jgi:phage major head subunit gpT-like protein
MDITATNQLLAFFTNVNTTLTLAYGTTETVYQKIATVIPTGTTQYAEGWTGMGRTMREWTGSRVTETPAPQTYFVTVQLWELTESFDVFVMKDDHTGLLSHRPTQLGMNIKKNEDYVLRDLLENVKSQRGSRQNGLDGISHWNSAHPVDFYDSAKGTYPNDYGTGGISINSIQTGGALALNSYATVWQDMANRKSESGEKLGLLPDMTMVPVMLKATATPILQAAFLGAPIWGNLGAGPGPNYAMVGTTENTQRGTSDLLVWPDLSSAAAWYMLVTNKPRKPFSIIQREAAQFLYRNAPTDPVVFDQHAFLYGAHSRMSPAWSFPWLSSRSGV